MCGAIGVAVLALVIVAGYVGPDTPLDNFAPTFVFIIFWVGLVFASVLFGDVFRARQPVARARAGRCSAAASRAPTRSGSGAGPPPPGCSSSRGSSSPRAGASSPRTLATAVLVYTVLTLGAMAVYGVEPWTRHGEAFSVYFNLFARLSVFETRDRVVGVRPLLGGLPRLDPVPGTVAVVAVMIGTVTYDGLSQGHLWKDLAVQLNDGFDAIGFGARDDAEARRHGRPAARRRRSPAASTRSGSTARARSAATSAPSDCGAASSTRLVPIAMVYVVAHYLTFLVFQGQTIFYLASDPLGEGWDLFGTATSAIDYGLLSQNAAVVPAGRLRRARPRRRARARPRPRARRSTATPKLAVRSQYWMLAIMVGFTTLALWLLAQANA